MKKYLPLYLRSLIAGLFLLMTHSAFASHIVGLDLNYQWQSGNTYQITLVVYGDCSGTAFPALDTAKPQICIYNAGTSVASILLTKDAALSGINVAPVCPADTGLTTCSGGTLIGIKKYTYTGTYTLSGTSHYWRFIFDGAMTGTSAGRSASITNINNPGTSISELVDTLDNTYHNNTSPVLSVVPTPYYCLNNADDYNPGASDGDGDSLHFYLVPGLNNTAATCAAAGTAGSVTYTAGYSATAPLSVSAGTFVFNTLTGEISFNPNVTQRSLVVYSIREYRNDTFIGTSQREMTFLVQTCTNTPPHGGIASSTGGGAIIDSTHYQICTGSGAFTLQMDPVEAAGTASITVTSSGLPAGSTVNVVNNGTPTPVVTFSWTATGPAPGLYTFYLVYQDNNCPIAGQSTYAFNVTINSLGAITGTNTVCAGSTTPLSNSTSGGTWTSGSTNATVGSSSGIVTGVTAGTATISYSVGTCFVTMIVTVNQTPTPILGSTHVCIGTPVTLSDATGVGTWSSSNGSATIGSSSGVLTGVTAGGNPTISYILSDGCYVTLSDTVFAPPSGITGTVTVCVGATTSLSDVSGGGTWSSSSAHATIGTSGIVTGVSAGTATISYIAATGCYATITVTVFPLPGAINPAPVTVCLGGTLALTDASGGGVWTSTNTTVAAVGTGGLLTAVGVGTSVISYVITGGCAATTIATVNTAPVAISPTSATVCTGSTTNLTDATSGGVWSSSSTNATVSGTGAVTGVTAGTATISYAIGTCFSTATVTINATPSVINPAPVVVCLGGTDALTDATAGGVWSSGTTTVATIGTSGLLTAVGVGTSTISYTKTGCSAITVATVNTAPVAISPATATVCTGSTTNLTDVTSGGVWSSSNPNATVSGTGVVSGVTAGTATISYTIGTCIATATVTVNTTPASINPAPVTVCMGGTDALTDATAGGVWSSATITVATIGTGGLLTAVGVGTSTISYTLAGCTAITIATVNTAPVAISPTTASVCTGSTTNLTDATGGGVWNSSNPNATVSGTGVVTGIAVGTATISYAIGTCFTTATVTVNLGVAAISPSSASICVGSTGALTDATGGGVWSSSNANATVSGIGVVTAVSTGTATISYTLGSCFATATVTLNTSPAALSPTSALVCVGSTVTLSDVTGGGAWSSSNTNANVAGGVVTGIAIGTATISYSISTCFTTATVTINPAISAGSITGPTTTVCPGASMNLTDAVSGGVWSASNGNATVSGTGLVTGVTVGTDVISYAVTTACGTATTTTTVTISASAASGTILGPLTVCAGSFDIYIDYTGGGAWSVTSGNAVISPGGVLTAITAGPETIIYSVPGACTQSTLNITIIPATVGAGTISGPSNACVGSSITLSDPTASGGTWSVTNTHATIGSASGLVTGVTAGLDTVIYTLTTACGTYTTSATVNVDATATPAPITGPSSVCVSSTILLSDADAGGAWSSSNGNATVTSGIGLVSGVLPGIDTVTYTVVNGCGLGSATKIITVLPTPSAGVITGPAAVCIGATISLTDATVPGGTWSATNGNATVNSTGVVTGVTAGTDNIVYTITAACGTVTTTQTITVNPLPDASTVLGPDSVCIGSTLTLLDFAAGGVWSAGNGNATVSATGIVTGVSVGTDPISYTVTNTCGSASSFKIVTVVDVPNPGVITGISNVCVGSAITLIDTIPGGIWLSSNGNATLIGPGIVSGVSAGIDSIFYVVTNLCGTNEARKIINVNPVPVVPSISGPSSQCVGTIVTYTDGLGGGIWTSSNATIASANISTGAVTGLTAGIVNISYTVTNAFGCPGSAFTVDTVMAIPVVNPIMGSSSVCLTATISLSDATIGGVWSSSNNAIGTVDALGNVTGTGAGVVMISYTVTSMCGSTSAIMPVTVNPLPVISAILGTTNICIGATTTLTNTTAGGTWSSSDTTIANINPATGLVTGGAAGGVTIIYSVTNVFGCTSAVSVPFTVNALPVVAAITGVTNACVGSGTTLNDATGGGIWSSSDNTIATVDASGNVTAVAGGTATISYTVTNGSGCMASATATYTVNTMPVTSVITGTMEICVGATTTLFTSVAGGVWSSTDNTIATVGAATGIVTGVAGGTDTIVYTITNSCGSVMDTATVLVDALPVISPISATFSSACVSTTIALSDATTGGVWSSSDITIASVDASGNVTGVSTGTATITYTVTNISGCSAFVTYNVTIAPAITGITVVPASATLCHGNMVNMHVATVVAGITYQWLFNGVVIPGATNSGYTADSAGNYSLVISNGVCNQTITGTVVSNQPNPVIGFTAPNILYTGSFFSYQWYKNGVAIPGATSSTYSEMGAGNYTVVVTDINGCSDTSAVHTIGGGTTGINNVAVAGIKVYPNPATSILTVDAPVKVNVSLLGVDGKLLIQQNDAHTINISQLANGMYMIMIYDENNLLLSTSKFVKTEQ